MPRPADPLPAHLGAVFRSGDARRAGVTVGRLRAADLDRPFRGIRCRAQPEAAAGHDADPSADERARRVILSRVRTHAPLLPPHAFYAGSTALALHGVELLDADAAARADLHVAVFAPHRALRRPGIHSFRVEPALARAVECEGVRVASPASTWALLGRELGLRDLVKIGDALARVPRDDRGRRMPGGQLASIDQLRRATEVGRRPGLRTLREALELVSERSMSLLETDWRLNLRDSDLPQPELDVEVRDARGILLGISDGAFPAVKLAVEIDGDHHRTSRAQWNRDIDKQAAYAAIGWETVRLTSAHIRRQPGRDVELVRAALIRRGWRP